jgi:uncharacterized protein YcfJ
MKLSLRTLLAGAGIVVATQAAAQVTFYEGENFRGRAFTANQTIWNFEPTGFNDRASSAVVQSGNWQACEDARFEGHCVVLRPGSYPSLAPMGMNRKISSVRPVDWDARYEQDAPAPQSAPTYEYRQRPDEELFQAPVTSVHAVMGPPEQRCWVERDQVVDRGAPNIGGAIVGGILGGVLGHQIGGGVGRDVATAGGAVAGAAIGSNVGRGQNSYGQDVQRCETVQNQGPPAFWDVTYNFQGVEHRVQLSAPPGATVTVNSNGEPRG